MIPHILLQDVGLQERSIRQVNNKYVSRFIKKSDPQIDSLIFKLKSTWWSRFYEYAWAASFAEPGATVLDAACGISHPLKFFLADKCANVYACDIDERILYSDSIIQEIVNDLGHEVAHSIHPGYFERIHFKQANLTQLPYSDSMFDTIFCISVLEHLNLPSLQSALMEFHRTLKKEGLIILTFDYPTIDLTLFQKVVQQQGLLFYGSVDLTHPADAISAYGLNCFRAVLAKNRPNLVEISSLKEEATLKRVLLASPVKQKKEILLEFLDSIDGLNVEGISLNLLFIDDNNDHNVLLEYRDRKDNVSILSSTHTGTYICDEITHRWQENLVWKVAAFKNQFIDLALAGGYDFLLLVDSDLYLQPQTLTHLMSLGKDIVSEVFWTQWEPDLPPLPQVWSGDQYRLFDMKREEELCEREKSERTQEFLARLETPGTYKVGGLGACTLLSRKALQGGVSFKEIYNLGLIGEDRHFCVRAAALGFELYADTFYPPFHIYRESELLNLTPFKTKIKRQEVVAHANTGIRKGKGLLTLAMLVRNEADRYLKQVLTHTKQFVDYAVILDDASEDDTIEQCAEILRETPHRIVSQPVSEFHNEVVLRKKLWQLAMATDCEWILILDADELFETKAVSELPQLLENARGIDYFSFRLYDMWQKNYYREDDYWQAHKVYRPLLVRKIPGFQDQWQETPQHCGRFPLNITGLNGAFSDLRVKHLGWQKPADRLKKYYRYKELDPQALYGIKAQYESILDPKPNLILWE